MLAPTREAAVRRTLAWAASGGARFDALDVRIDDAGGCATVARRPIAAGERVVTVPRGLMILHDELAATAAGQVDPYGPAVEIGHDTLAAWLGLELARADSPWRTYLDGLPAALPEVPLFRAEADLEALAGTAAWTAAVAARAAARDFHGRLRPALRERLSLDAWTWGRALVRSRGYTVAIDGRTRCALVPIADLLDHRPGDTRWRFDPDEDAYTIDAVRAIDAGEPVHATYGALSNARLLVHYGFALPDNPDDEAALVFPSATVVVGRRVDPRWRRALALAGGELAALHAAARAGLDCLGEPRPPAADAWQRACDLVRDGERAVLAHVLALDALPTD